MYQNPDTSIILGNQALALSEKLIRIPSPGIQILKLKATSYGNMGVYYHFKSGYPMALDFYFKALKINEELHNKKGIASSLGNVGIAYKEQGKLSQSVKLLFEGNENGRRTWG